MNDIIKELIDRKVSPKALAAGIVLAMSKGSLEQRQLAQGYLENWEHVIDEPKVRKELWQEQFIAKGEKPLLECEFRSQFTIKTKDDLMEMAEELWDAYPVMFPLSGGGSFIARKGGDKIEILKMYLERIENSPEKHEFVLQQLIVFSKMVYAGKVNGVRIQEWVTNELWDSIVKPESVDNFKTDI
jgi:hypothetical protein